MKKDPVEKKKARNNTNTRSVINQDICCVAKTEQEAGICCVTSLLLVVLFILHADIYYLKDVVVGAELQRSNVDLDVVFQKVLGQLANLFRPGSAPHQCLSVRLVARSASPEMEEKKKERRTTPS